MLCNLFCFSQRLLKHGYGAKDNESKYYSSGKGVGASFRFKWCKVYLSASVGR